MSTATSEQGTEQKGAVERGGVGTKPHIRPLNGGGWLCVSWIDRGAGETPLIAYYDMIYRADERERNRRCWS